jgi:hypothetical protein
MGYWQEKYESIQIGTQEVDGQAIKVYRMVAKKGRWIPRMIPDPILKGQFIYDLADKEPQNS